MIVLYSTGCPKCKVLETKLKQKKIDFSISDDLDKVIEQGFLSAPILEVDGNFMEFKKAVDWVKRQEG